MNFYTFYALMRQNYPNKQCSKHSADSPTQGHIARIELS